VRGLFLAVAALALAGCATLQGGTVAQRLYEAHGLYNVAKAAAVDYAEAPTASPAVVKALNAANKELVPTVRYVRAYILCGGTNAGAVGGFDCTQFDFRATTASGYAVALRAAAASILTKTGAAQ